MSTMVCISTKSLGRICIGICLCLTGWMIRMLNVTTNGSILLSTIDNGRDNDEKLISFSLLVGSETATLVRNGLSAASTNNNNNNNKLASVTNTNPFRSSNSRSVVGNKRFNRPLSLVTVTISNESIHTVSSETMGMIDNTDYNIDSILSSWYRMAVWEAGINISVPTTYMKSNGINTIHNSNVEQIFIPISGYRQCLTYSIPDIEKRTTNVILYMGTNVNYCTNNNNNRNKKERLCYRISNNMTGTNFLLLSDIVCKSQGLVCGIGSTYLCSILGMSVRTPIYVDTIEHNTWPIQFQQTSNFHYIIVSNTDKLGGYYNTDSPNDSIKTIQQISTMTRDNHRIVFDRYTIKATHPQLLQNIAVRFGTSTDPGFNVFLYSDPGLCPSNRTIPLRYGNMGDTMGSYVAYTIATHLNMSMHVRCNEDGKKTAIPPPSHHLTFAFIGSFAGPANRDVNPTSLSTNTGRQNSTNQRRYSIVAPQSMSYRNILLGMGLTDAKGSRISTRKVPFADVLGVRGPLTRDLYLMKQGINPEVVGDPGLYFSTIFGNEVEEARRLASMSTDQAILDDGQQTSMGKAELLLYQTIKDLCFISHEVEHNWFVTNLNEYQNVTLRAGKLGDGGNIYDAVKFISTCKAIVSSSLHGVVFAHSLSIPALPIQVTDKLYGGDFKFYDYYYSINVTNFHGRYSIVSIINTTTPNSTMVPKKSKDEWIQLVQSFPQPTFSFNNNNVHILDIVKALYQK